MALIITTEGEIDETLLEKREVRTELPTGKGYSEATEYYLDGKLVKKDIVVTVTQL